jgi:hypothetical protein
MLTLRSDFGPRERHAAGTKSEPSINAGELTFRRAEKDMKWLPTYFGNIRKPCSDN